MAFATLGVLVTSLYQVVGLGAVGKVKAGGSVMVVGLQAAAPRLDGLGTAPLSSRETSVLHYLF